MLHEENKKVSDSREAIGGLDKVYLWKMVIFQITNINQSVGHDQHFKK